MRKTWTILIYANGNNEFEPEMHQLLLDCRKIKHNENLNIVIQIGREKRELVKILRPKKAILESNNDWSGVRRYFMEPDSKKDKACQPVLVKDLMSLNMANPKNLYDFLEWGIGNYPAEKYMLFVGGHSFQYMGIMTDYSQNLPYIMGLSEMCSALNLVKTNTGKNLDILVFDTCYMNMAEILYELAKEKNHTVKNVLTYIEYGPISGLPLDKLISILIENMEIRNSKQLLTRIIDELNYDLVAFELNRKKLEKIKRLVNDLGRAIIKNENMKPPVFSTIWENINPEKPWYKDINKIKENLQELLIHYKRVANEKSSLLDIAHIESKNKLAAYYTKLSFTKNNYWTKLLGVEFLKEGVDLEGSSQLKPIVLPLQALVSLISVMNPNADEKEIGDILHRLFEYKGWEHFSNVKLNEN